jgi:uncharacterized protein YndB with AHSA1/START domain
MTPTTPIAPIHHDVEVPVDATAAFNLFTDRIGDWWPPEHQLGDAPKVTAIMEPGIGGRVFEVGADGSRCQWGTVTVWEPPRRLVVAWQITGRWTPEPDLTRSSEYEVTFTPNGERSTLVAVEHRHLERHGETGPDIARAVDGPQGWPHVLAGLRELAATEG